MFRTAIRISVLVVLSLAFLFAGNKETTHATPTASGANPPYPLNHTFDADIQVLDTTDNSDFETDGEDTGTPADNYDLNDETAPGGDYPTNYDFETGDFTGWSTSGSTSIQSNGQEGYYAKLGSSGKITSSAIDIDADAQVFIFRLGYLSSAAGVKVYVLSGGGYGTSTLVETKLCASSCNGNWSTIAVDATPWQGQSIKLKFERYVTGYVGINDPHPEILFVGNTTSGLVKRWWDNGGVQHNFARLENGASITSGAFTVDTSAQYLRVRINGADSYDRSQYKIYVLSGAGYSTSTQVAVGYADYGWQTVSFSASSWTGESIKVKVEELAYNLGADDLGEQWIEVTDWDVTESTWRKSDGGGGHYISTNGQITSQAFTVPTGTQQISFRYKGNGSGATFYAELLHGTNFSETTDLVGYQAADENNWKTLKASIGSFEGQTVKFRLRQWFGNVLFDDAGLLEDTVPGWTITGTQGVDVGSDIGGTYVTASDEGNAISLQSSDVSLDIPGSTYLKYFQVTYEIGYSTGSIMRVYWVNDSEDDYVVMLDTADSPTGIISRYFWVAGVLGDEGHFIVNVTDGGKIYSISDNIARQQLAEPFSQKVGFQVDSSSGSFGFTDRDMVVPGRMPLVLTRYYAGHSDSYGELGYRWNHTFSTHLVIADDGTGGNVDDAGVVFGSGAEEFFTWDDSGEYFYPADPRVHDELELNMDGTYTLTTTQQLEYNFTSAGQLTTIVDDNDNTITLSYDGYDRLETVEDPDGRDLTFSYDGNSRLESVTGPEDMEIDYEYDGNGDLISATDAEDGVREYTYDKHRLVSATDGEGNVLFTNSFDSVNRVVTQTDPEDFTIDIEYDTPSVGVTTATDLDGNEALYYFDEHHRTTDKVDPLGNTVSYSYDSTGNLDTIIDPNFDEWDFGFDSNGDLTDAEDPLGNPISITYNAKHLPTTVTDARGYTTYMTYDSDGNPLTVTDPTREVLVTSEDAISGCGQAGTGDGVDDDADTVVDDGCPSTIYTYDGEGKMTSMTDAIGRTETYGYTNGNRTSMVDGNSKTWDWTYDDAGRVTSETNPENETTEYVYDLFGRPILERNNLDEETTYLYDLAGHLLMVEDELGNQTFWDYDERGLVERKIDADDNEIWYTYDANRNMTSVTEPTRLPVDDPEEGTECGTGKTGDGVDDDADTVVDDGCPSTYYTYDDANRLATVTDGTGGTTTYEYDDAGHLASEEDPLSRVTSYEYDDAGQLVLMTLPNDGEWSYTYDDNGNLLTETDPLDNVTSYTYDPLNRRATVTDPLNNDTEYTYDPAGQLIEVLDAEMNTTSYEYDDAGRMISITDPMMNVREFEYDDAGRRITVIDGLDRETAYGYDGAGRLSTITAPGNFTTTYAYDGAGRMTSVTRPNGGVTSYTYDPRGLVTAITDPLRQTNVTAESGSDCGTDGTGDGVDDDSDTYVDDGCPSTIYGYDDSGRRTSMIDALGLETTYEFDPAGRMTAMTDALDGTVSFGYDAAGQQTSVTNALDNTTTYTYDDLGNMATKTNPLSRVYEWVYDDAGRLVETTDARDVTVTYGYDDNGNLTGVTYSGGSVSYAYDDINRRTSMTDSTGTTTWNYDAASRVTSVVSPAGTVAYTYNDADARETMTLPGSRTFTYDYNATTGRLDSIEDWESRVVSFTYDDNGNRTGIDRENGIDSTYTYDLADRLTSVLHEDGQGTVQSFSYTLDAVGNRTSVTSGAGTESYTLDDLNRVTDIDYPSGDDVEYEYDENGNITEMTVGMTTTTYTYDDADELTSDGTNSYYYDENGNLTDAGSDEFTWDYRNMMTSATISSTTTDYEYDGDGVRVSKDSTDHLYDREAGLPMLVDDETNAYLHNGGILASIDSNDDPTYLLDDALGSVRGATDDGGSLVGTTDYDVYGEVRASSGASTLFRFTGEQSDPETGFTYLRARYANPALGRFISADTVQPNAPGTQGYNPYAYVANNPTTWLDPSGHAVDTIGYMSEWIHRPDVWALAMASLMWERTSAVTGAGLLLLSPLFMGTVRTPTKPVPPPSVGTPPPTPPEKKPVLTPLRIGIGALLTASGILTCKMVGPCADLARRIADALPRGSDGPAEETRPDPSELPRTPRVSSPTPATGAKTCSQIGQWVPEGAMTDRALNYQHQVQDIAASENPGREFLVNSTPPVKVDGCHGGVLIEAKGCYSEVISKFPWILDENRGQMRSQSEAAFAVGSPGSDWYFAESEMADLHAPFAASLPNISVQYLQAKPPC